MNKSKKILFAILIVIVGVMLSTVGYNKFLESKAQKIANNLASAVSVENISDEDVLRVTGKKMSEDNELYGGLGISVSDDYLILSYWDLFNNSKTVKAKIDR